jgi:putative glutamine amidotransferase
MASVREVPEFQTGEVPDFKMDGPRIALTWSSRATRPADRYLEAVAAAGGVPLLTLPEDGLRDLRTADGVVLAGGRDVHPARYGQEIDPRVAAMLEPDEARDQFELDAIALALDRGLPVLGICRGIQVLNVALGGTVLQDVSLAGIELSAHQQRRRSPEPPEWEAAHDVRLEPGSRLAGILGVAVAPVNSFHHQAVDRPAEPLRVTARAPDGIVEGVEAPDRSFLIGVQWHPERMVAHHPAQRALFAAFVTAAGEARRRRSS